MPEYVTQIDGYIITNVYNPDTGDALRPGLYSFLMALSLLGCACVTLLLKKKEWYC